MIIGLYRLFFDKNSTHPVCIKFYNIANGCELIFNLDILQADNLAEVLNGFQSNGLPFHYTSEQKSKIKVCWISSKVVRFEFGHPGPTMDQKALLRKGLAHSLSYEIKGVIIPNPSIKGSHANVVIIDELTSVSTVEENQRKRTDDNLKGVFR